MFNGVTARAARIAVRVPAVEPFVSWHRLGGAGVLCAKHVARGRIP